jgi:hypothetical protein
MPGANPCYIEAVLAVDQMIDSSPCSALGATWRRADPWGTVRRRLAGSGDAAKAVARPCSAGDSGSAARRAWHAFAFADGVDTALAAGSAIDSVPRQPGPRSSSCGEALL